MEAKLRQLICDYLKLAGEVCQILSKQAGTEDILKSVRSDGFPRQGHFGGFGGGTYFIHGVGCEIHSNELEIDFDFGPNGQIPGFDVWKLYDFARNHSDAYSWIPKREEFKSLIEHHIKAKELVRSGKYPSPHLLCLIK